MDLNLVFQFLILIIAITNVIILIIFNIKQNRDSQNYLLQKFIEDEFSRNRDENYKFNKEVREELSSSLKSFEEKMDNSSKMDREELKISLKDFEEKFSARIDVLTKETNVVFEKNRETIEKKLTEIQENNNVKLEEIRKTVDEKLHDTLEKRFTESFKLVSDNLNKVQRGIGEMQTLASGVGDLKKVLSNVKTKGMLGEYQLAAILDEILSPSQYDKNVKTKDGSDENVEFAIRLPHNNKDTHKPTWLPIDSKFSTSDYEELLNMYEVADLQKIEQLKKSLENKIKKFAKDIHEKYIDPPNTTEFAIMFLPFEGLYAEVLRIPNLFQKIHMEFKITITGPTTISAFLNSLQMGFRSLAIEKRTSEIWDLLGAVKMQFIRFAETLESTKKKLDSASKELEKTGISSRQIEKQLKDIQLLPESDSQKLLGF